jgi:hypothetical protein
MSLQTWRECYVTSQVDGPTLTAAAAATCIPPAAKALVLPNGFFYIGRKVKITAQGRISVANPSPGTGRFDVRLGGTVVFDTAAFNLNATVAKTNVPWWLEIDLICRAIGSGTSANLFGFANFQSEAVVGSPANTAGGNGSLLAPVGAPAVGAGFDSTAALSVDLFFTQNVATGSLTVHLYAFEALN